MSIKPQKFEIQCLGYPLANFQLLMISGLLRRCDNILVSFFAKKIFITQPISLVFKPNSVSIKMCLMYLLMRAKLEGNPIIRLHFM